MWEYIKKIIEYVVFACLLEGVILVARLSCEGLFDAAGEVLKIVLFVAPAIMAGLAVLSLCKVQRRRKRGRYEREPIGAGVLAVLAVVAVILVVGTAVGVNVLGGYLYNG
jgi:hypothetical protein